MPTDPALQQRAREAAQEVLKLAWDAAELGCGGDEEYITKVAKALVNFAQAEVAQLEKLLSEVREFHAAAVAEAVARTYEDAAHWMEERAKTVRCLS